MSSAFTSLNVEVAKKDVAHSKATRKINHHVENRTLHSATINVPKDFRKKRIKSNNVSALINEFNNIILN